MKEFLFRNLVNVACTSSRFVLDPPARTLVLPQEILRSMVLPRLT